MLEMTQERSELLKAEFWTLEELARFIGVKRQRLYYLIAEQPERFPEHYKRRELWESPVAPRIYRHPNPKRQRQGPIMRYIEWWEQQNPVREAERMAV